MNEEPRKAVAREVKEETNCIAIPGRILIVPLIKALYGFDDKTK
ncbi:hypothetical protein [Acetivibrio sp.]|nr:hypothetical protein [Acetivibrio sp.]